jgi:hypothetical protein
MTDHPTMVSEWQPISDEEAAAIREKDWKELHWQLRSLAQQRVALEAKETSLLLEAEESRLYRRLGYSTMIEYMERELHWGTHAANERLRVARELLALPLIADTFERGELCFSAVRELTRVATSENEHEFLAKAQGRTARDVERMVAGLRRGDSPEDDPDPKLIKKKIVLEVSTEVWARYRRTRTEREKAYGQRLDDSELLDGLLRDAAAPTAGQVTKPAVQVAVTICKSCKKSFTAAGGQQVPIDDATSDWLTCDAELIGDLESNDLTRPKSHIPDAIRRKVMQRDGFACIVPGCTATRNLDVHHFEHRQHGGNHTVENCGTLCGGHHKQHHFGRLEIMGSSDDRTFTWHTDEGVMSATTGTPWEFVEEEDSVPHGTGAG